MITALMLLGMLDAVRVAFNSGASDLSSLGAWTAEQFDPRLSWDDVAWIKQRRAAP